MGYRETRMQLREALESPGCTAVVPVVDVLTARLAYETGWRICKLNSSGLKAVNYGLPDEVAGIVTVSDYADVIRRISRTVPDISIMVDADDCGGSPESVARWVSDLEAAGVAGIEIEDRGYMAFSEMGGDARTHLHSIDSQVANLTAALEARSDPSTVIIARTTSFTPTEVREEAMSTGEARARVRAYAGAGVDALMFPGVTERVRDDAQLVRQETDLPQCWLRMPSDLIRDSEFLEQNHIRIRYLSQSTVFGRIVPFVYELMQALREDRDGTAAMSAEDREFGGVGRTSHLGEGSAAALSLITTPRYRHQFIPIDLPGSTT